MGSGAFWAVAMLEMQQFLTPQLLRDDLVADFGAFLEVTVVGTRSTGNCNVTISAELVLKD